MTNDKQAIAAKIKALFSKTVENGASEEEALSAVTLARKLMEKYQLNMSEVEVKAEGFENRSISATTYFKNFIAKRLAWHIGRLTNTKCVLFGGDTVKFYGFRSDVEFADWVYKHLENYILKAALKFGREEKKAGAPKLNRRVFINGAIDRIAERIREEIKAQEANKVTSIGTGLVVVDRMRLVTEEFAKLNMRLKPLRLSNPSGTSDAYNRGREHGNNAQWNKPVNGTGATLRLK